MSTISQLLRESNPPPGQPRSPLPQIYDRVTQGPAVVEGYNGAPAAVLLGPDNTPIRSNNRLPVDVGEQVATEQTLTQAVNRLNSILARLEGKLDARVFDSQGNAISSNNRLPVDVGGQIHADVDLGDVTVQIGEVQQGKRGTNAEPWEVSLSGRKVSLVVSEIIRTDEIAPRGSESIVVTPAEGHIGWLKWIGVRVAGVVGASSGIHRVLAGVPETGEVLRFLQIEASNSVAFFLVQPTRVINATMVGPSNASGLLNLLAGSGLPFGRNAGIDRLVIRYHNETDVPQTGERRYQIRYIQEAIVP